MYVLIFRLYNILKGFFVTQVKEGLSFIHRGLNIWGINILGSKRIPIDIFPGLKKRAIPDARTP